MFGDVFLWTENDEPRDFRDFRIRYIRVAAMTEGFPSVGDLDHGIHGAAMKAILIAGTVLAACGGLYTAFANPPFWIEGQIRKSMASYAHDPEDLKFSDLRYSEKNRDYICGYVNGRNSVSAYVGQKRFAYSRKVEEFYMIGHSLSPQYALDASGCFK